MTIYETYCIYLHIFAVRSRMYSEFCDSKHAISQLRRFIDNDKICIYAEKKMKDIKRSSEWNQEDFNEFIES